VGYGLFVMALLHPRISFRPPPPAFWCFALYVLIFTLLMAFQPLELLEEILERVLTMTQLLFLFWISYNLMRYPAIAGRALLVFGVSCAACAFLQVAGLAQADLAEERQAAFGQNPNALAAILDMGILAIVGLGYRAERTALPYGLTWLLLGILGIAVVQTGSRGGLLTLAAGLAVFLFAGSRRARIGKALILILATALVVALSYFSGASRRRWEETLGAGSLAHREQLYPAAWEIFTEEPVVRWGPVTSLYELGGRTRDIDWVNPEERKRDTHNLALHVLTATGLLGTIPFAAGIWLCVLAAYKGRHGIEGMAPLAMTLSLLVSNMSGDRVYMKFHWVVLAYGLASGCQILARAMPTRSPVL